MEEKQEVEFLVFAVALAVVAVIQQQTRVLKKLLPKLTTADALIKQNNQQLPVIDNLI